MFTCRQTSKSVLSSSFYESYIPVLSVNVYTAVNQQLQHKTHGYIYIYNFLRIKMRIVTDVCLQGNIKLSRKVKCCN